MSATARPSLAGVRVLDLGWVWAGPLVGAAMAEMGAEVVKVESSLRMDPYRMRGVERRRDLGDLRREASPSFHKLNRSKKSLALNLKEEEARDLLVELAKRADILIENFSAGTLERLGIGWPRLHAANPRLVVVSMSAGGQTGRWSDLKAYALITSALAGYESLIGYDGEAPVGGSTFGVADPTVSAYGLMGAFAGLWRARRTGVGCHVDLSGVEALMSVMPYAFIEAANGDAAADGKRYYRADHLELTVGDPEQDRWLVAVFAAPADWERLRGRLPELPLPEWQDLLSSPQLRDEARRSLEALGLERVEIELRAAGAPYSPVLSVEERNETPPIADIIGTLEHPVTGSEPAHPSPWGAWQELRPAPLLGEHTDSVLREWLGLDDDEIADLRERGMLA